MYYQSKNQGNCFYGFHFKLHDVSLKWVVGSTCKLLSFLFNEIVCNLFFKIVLFLLLVAGDIGSKITLITLYPFYTTTLEVYTQYI